MVTVKQALNHVHKDGYMNLQELYEHLAKLSAHIVEDNLKYSDGNKPYCIWVRENQLRSVEVLVRCISENLNQLKEMNDGFSG